MECHRLDDREDSLVWEGVCLQYVFMAFKNPRKPAAHGIAFLLRMLLPVAVVLAACSPGAGRVEAPVRPNIILILADDMGFSDLGSYGGEIPTPNIDSLAAGGARFTQFYNNARCSPTRASLQSAKLVTRT